jgi:hypothetical protein
MPHVLRSVLVDSSYVDANLFLDGDISEDGVGLD